MDFSFYDVMMSLGKWSYLLLLATIIVHIAFGAATFNDARGIKNNGGHLAFVGPVIWSIAVLVGGVFVSLAYWVMHHSSIKR